MARATERPGDLDGAQPEVVKIARISGRILFDFEDVEDTLEPCDGIVVFGNHDEHVAERAADLYSAGLARSIIFTGGYGRITRDLWGEPEAVRFGSIARERGVPSSAILLDETSSNTGENIAHARELIREHGLASERLIMVDRPYRLLRTKLALEAQWPGQDFLMAAPELSFEEYWEWYATTGPIDVHAFIALLVGDAQRIDVYGERGFQAPCAIPTNVREAYDRLVQAGFTEQMLH